MRIWAVAFFTISALYAADEQRLALSLKAESEFSRVQSAPAPVLKDAIACIQTEASWLPLAMPEELTIAHYRKGLCLLTSAVVTRDATEFASAAGEFDKAVETWPAHAAALAHKGAFPDPVPSGLRVLAAMARLQNHVDTAEVERAWKEISPAVESPKCNTALMPTAFCDAVTKTGHFWLGWMSLRQDGLSEAATEFTGAESTGWPQWVAGRKAFRDRQYAEAARQYRVAVDLARRGTGPSLLERLAPQPDVPGELTELGGAQLLAGDSGAAIASLDEAVKADPASARALFLRARAKEAAGKPDAALADYNLASRTAFASAKDLASGEAHLYRGIILYRRRDFVHAEDEFSSALNFDIDGGLRADAVAWRHLAAVASGSCGASSQYLARSLAAASPYFPRSEARALLTGCSTTSSGEPPLAF